jgi:hypothetical protein
MSWGLWDCRRVQGSHVPQPQARSSSIYGPGTSVKGADNQWPFKRGGCLFPRDDFLRGTFLCCGPSYYVMQSPHHGQVLTGVLPYSNKPDMVNDIIHGKRPPRPTDPTQNRWLQDHVWGMITTCWSKKPEQRCELSVVYRVFSTPSPKDLLAEFPLVGRENCIRLTEELLYMFLVLPLDPSQRTTLRRVQQYVSDVMSRDRTSPRTLSSAGATALTETFHTVSFSRSIFPRSLKLLMARPYGAYRTPYHVPRFAYGLEFIPTLSSLTCGSSQT